MSRLADNKRGGYSLLEMLVYVAVLAVGINLFVSLLATGSRLTATTTLQMSRMEGIRDVQETFVNYVRRAAAVVPKAGEYETSDNLVVLEMPPGQPEGFSHLVLGNVFGADQFSILGLAEDDGEWSTVYLRSLRQPLGLQQYQVKPGAGGTLVSVDIQVKHEDGERKREFLVHRTSATPRGKTGVIDETS